MLISITRNAPMFHCTIFFPSNTSAARKYRPAQYINRTTKDPITFVSYQWKLSNFVYPHMHPNKIASKKNGTENKFNP